MSTDAIAPLGESLDASNGRLAICGDKVTV
jgi:hypothetical protein